jgi:class 3 adenylate cyclase
MDKYNKEAPNDLRIDSIKISYQGSDVGEEATSLHNEIYQRLHLKTNPPTEIRGRIPRLGVIEILIPIILAPIVQYAVNSTLNALRDFFRNRRKKAYKVQIIIKLYDDDPGRRFPFRTEETDWEKVFRSIDKHLKETREKSLSELIEKRTKIDEEMRKFFEEEATFLDIDVVSSKRLMNDEQDLMISAYSFEQYYKYVKEKVEENKGTVLNAVGAEVMAWFSAPSDAISCALAIFKHGNEFNRQRSKLKNPFQFKIGINTGLVLIDEKEGEVFARGVLDLAGHLQKEAEPGKFLISENTYNKLEDKSSFHKHKCIDGDKIWSYIFAGIIDNEPVK